MMISMAEVGVDLKGLLAVNASPSQSACMHGGKVVPSLIRTGVFTGNCAFRLAILPPQVA